MTTLLRPHQAVKCPDKDGALVGVGTCEECPNLLELRRPWRGFVVKCSAEGESDNAAVEYG